MSSCSARETPRAALWLKHLSTSIGDGRFKAYSAGSKPTGKVNLFAITQLGRIGYASKSIHSKSWNEFAGDESPVMDIVITVCDNAANEVCPVWPGEPLKLHWGFEDPAAVSGNDADKQQAFEHCCDLIRQKVEKLAALSLHEHSQAVARG